MTRSIYRDPWRVDVTVRDGVTVPVPLAALARAMTGALDAVGATGPASIGLILSDDRELTELNEAHMGARGPTDVLSFPLDPGPGFVLPPRARPHLGDVVVSVERAVDQARSGRGGHAGDVRWPPADELRLLVIHGTLHVCGMDHAEPAEEAVMRALEDRLLAG